MGFVYGLKGHSKDEFRVAGLWVKQGCRGKKVGSRLVKAVMTWAEKKSAKPVIKCWSPFDETTKFYARLGFKFTSNTRKRRPEVQDKIIEMVLDL